MHLGPLIYIYPKCLVHLLQGYNILINYNNDNNENNYNNTIGYCCK